MDPISIIAGILRTPQGQDAAVNTAGFLARPAKGTAALTGMADPSVAPWLQPSIIPEKYNYPYGTPQKKIDDDKMHALGEQFLGFGGVMKAAGPKIAQALRAAPAAEAPGIRAYHGSPYDFDRFDLSKIGTGEGAQAYGHGLYFAEAEKVAKRYRDDLTPTYYFEAGRKLGPAEQNAASMLLDHKMTKEAALDYIKNSLRPSRMSDQRYLDETEAALRVLDPAKITREARGRMYEVNIRAKPEEFLDWDKPLSGQARSVQDVIRKLPESVRTLRDPLGHPAPQYGEPLGSEVYKKLERQLAGEYPGATKGYMPPPGFNAGDLTSGALRTEGIPGIRYLDQGSRPNPERIKRLEEEIRIFEKNAPKNRSDPWYVKTLGDYKTQLAQMRGEGQTSNYVLFRDDIIDILRKYGIPPVGIAGVGALGAAAMPDQAQAADLTPTGIARALRETK